MATRYDEELQGRIEYMILVFFVFFIRDNGLHNAASILIQCCMNKKNKQETLNQMLMLCAMQNEIITMKLYNLMSNMFDEMSRIFQLIQTKEYDQYELYIPLPGTPYNHKLHEQFGDEVEGTIRCCINPGFRRKNNINNYLVKPIVMLNGL